MKKPLVKWLAIFALVFLTLALCALKETEQVLEQSPTRASESSDAQESN